MEDLFSSLIAQMDNAMVKVTAAAGVGAPVSTTGPILEDMDRRFRWYKGDDLWSRTPKAENQKFLSDIKKSLLGKFEELLFGFQPAIYHVGDSLILMMFSQGALPDNCHAPSQ